MMCQGKIKNSKESDAPTRPVVNVDCAVDVDVRRRVSVSDLPK
jgi:hypothetical protein